MSIATSITGGGASNQLMDLLAVVANPDVYKAKIDALDAATAENKKYVELAAPASEILVMREQIKAKNAEADAELADAKDRAANAVKEAKEKAASLVSAAQAKADALVAAATENKAATDALMAQAKAELAAAQKATADAVKAQASAQAKEQVLSKALEDAAAAQAEAEATKADILAKHQAFVEGL
jgi:spore maturation protein CgeB